MVRPGILLRLVTSGVWVAGSGTRIGAGSWVGGTLVAPVVLVGRGGRPLDMMTPPYMPNFSERPNS